MSTSASESLTTTAADLAQLFGAHDPSMGVFPTDALVARMLDFGEGISDLVFSPGRPPQVEQHGQLTPVPTSGLVPLTTDHTARIARHLVTGHRSGRVCASRPGRVRPVLRAAARAPASASTSSGSAAPSPS